MDERLELMLFQIRDRLLDKLREIEARQEQIFVMLRVMLRAKKKKGKKK